MTSDDAEVRLVLAALTPHIRDCEEPLTAQAIGNGMLGLQGIKSAQN
jgi:hypothetical protein